MKKIMICFFAMSLCNWFLYAKNFEQQKDSVNIRNIYFKAGIGYPNLGSIGCGFQIDNNWSIGVNLNLYNNKNRDPGIYFGTLTYGLKTSRFFNKPILHYLNNCSLEIGYYDYRDGNNRYRQQSSFELTVGNENKNDNRISIGYQFGVALITTSYSAPSFTPSIKILLTINF